VLLDYGPRSNAQLLNTHGFALPTTAHEQLQLELRPPADDPLAPLKVRILEAGNLTSPYSLGRSSLSSDSNLLVALRVLAATRDELAGSEQTGDKGRGYARAFEGSPISQGNELRWQEMLARRLRPLLEEREALSTGLEDAALLGASDAARLGAPLAAGAAQRSRGHLELGSRRRLAVVTRASEKLMLRQLLAELEGRRRASDRALAAARAALVADKSEL